MPNEFDSNEAVLRSDLERDFSDLDQKDKQLNSQKIISENKLRRLKMDIMKQLFSSLVDLGVDPSNVESISKFLQKLERQDPDLAKLFESAFNDLLPGEGIVDSAMEGIKDVPGLAGGEEPAPVPVQEETGTVPVGPVDAGVPVGPVGAGPVPGSSPIPAGIPSGDVPPSGIMGR